MIIFIRILSGPNCLLNCLYTNPFRWRNHSIKNATADIKKGTLHLNFFRTKDTDKEGEWQRVCSKK